MIPLRPKPFQRFDWFCLVFAIDLGLLAAWLTLTGKDRSDFKNLLLCNIGGSLVIIIFCGRQRFYFTVVFGLAFFFALLLLVFNALRVLGHGLSSDWPLMVARLFAVIVPGPALVAAIVSWVMKDSNNPPPVPKARSGTGPQSP